MVDRYVSMTFVPQLDPGQSMPERKQREDGFGESKIAQREYMKNLAREKVEDTSNEQRIYTRDSLC